MNEINVVPYIDVMLVLLVIFMVTAPLMNPGVIDLPDIGQASTPPALPIEVSIRANGNLSVIDRDISGAERPVSRAELVEVIKSKQ
ncbi:MAG: biopolymer transporter ExbD, partial [Gallionellaceae bacterium]|nr:biopolymer transporter ExbD [Gallionellaceae bacterium]